MANTREDSPDPGPTEGNSHIQLQDSNLPIYNMEEERHCEDHQRSKALATHQIGQLPGTAGPICAPSGLTRKLTTRCLTHGSWIAWRCMTSIDTKSLTQKLNGAVENNTRGQLQGNSTSHLQVWDLPTQYYKTKYKKLPTQLSLKICLNADCESLVTGKAHTAMSCGIHRSPSEPLLICGSYGWCEFIHDSN